jgi:hypothetical protein
VAVSDLAVGDQVRVVGAAGSDGTVTATRISEGGRFPGGGGPGTQGGPPDQGATTPTTA